MMDFRLIKLFLFLTLIFGYSAGVAWAHGGGVPQLTNAEAGPYQVSVWTQPNPLQAGEAHFTVSVSEPPASDAGEGRAGSPVLGATIELQLKLAEEPEQQALAVLATHEAAVNKLFYEADVELPEAGQWQVTYSVEGPAGSGSTGFEIEVVSASGVNWILFGGLGLVLLAAGWVTQTFRKQKTGD